MKMTVKQRPGMNYPRPVNNVKVSEVNRAPFKMFGGSLAPAVPTAVRNIGARVGAHKSAGSGEECYDEGFQQ
jgi:hypothetical protein